jgi:HipA-like protein
MPYSVPKLRTVNVDRYVLPLREGGSVPGLIEADDGDKYVVKFRGSAQGPKVLIAELIGGEIARALGLNMPELVFAQLDAAFGRIEHDEEIQSQLKASAGLNIALSYLPGSIMFDPMVTAVDPEIASRIVWLDSLITNPDRTVNNPNMLMWNKKLWLIDHGASLFFHYSWNHPPAQLAMQAFNRVKHHVLLPHASMLDMADAVGKSLLTGVIIHDIVSMIPEEWLIVDSPFNSADEHRQAYEEYLLSRIEHSHNFVKEANHARQENI